MRAAGLTISEELTGRSSSLLTFNRPELRAVGVPGGGGVMNASSMALFYQALLSGKAPGDGAAVWEPQILRDALRVRTGDLRDPMTGRLANRALGVVIAGDEDRVFRSFAPGNSEGAFGHAGAGGQIAWSDPASGLSFAFFTNGCDLDPIAMGSRGISLANAATRCVTGASVAGARTGGS
jgi:CubicO group peptidase (beta-lactamase class C family)